MQNKNGYFAQTGSFIPGNIMIQSRRRQENAIWQHVEEGRITMITLEHVTKTYAKNNTKAVDDLSLTVNGGELFGFIGPNGAGKTTTIKLMTGILTPDEGTVTIENYYSTLGPVSVTANPYIPAEPVSKATVIRAVSQREDGTFSKEAVAVYFVGEDIRRICDGLYTLSIVSDPQGLFSGKRGIYVTGNVWDMNMDRVDGEETDLHTQIVDKLRGEVK